ncbi:MAG: pyridoxamine 5'-phosphate oxidase family protein [Lapillicoccus sp.]
MNETQAELDALQALLDRSHAGASDHLRGIIDDRRTLSAREIAGLMTGMRVVSFATVTAGGEPRISALDGHFLNGHWTLSTLRSSPKGRQLVARPAVSAACIEGEELAVFTHGRAVVLEGDELAEVDAHWTAHYGSSPLSWGDVVLFRLEPTWMVGYVSDRTKVLAKRGVPEDPRESSVLDIRRPAPMVSERLGRD